MYVTDTHPLVWYIDGKKSNLSKKVQQVFEQTETAETLIYVPAVVFWEIALLNKTGRVKMRKRFDHWVADILAVKGFELAHLEIDAIYRSIGYEINRDPFDNMIVATAANLELPLITKDVAISESKLVEIYW